MAYDKAIEAIIQELYVGEQGLTAKAMFGGVCYLVGGNMAFGIYKRQSNRTPRLPGTGATGNRIRAGLPLRHHREGHEGVGDGSQGQAGRSRRLQEVAGPRPGFRENPAAEIDPIFYIGFEFSGMFLSAG